MIFPARLGRRSKEAVANDEISKEKESTQTRPRLPDLEQAKSAVLNTLTSKSGQRTYDHAITEFVEWYCSEPRLAFNRTVVLRYRISLEQRRYAPSTISSSGMCPYKRLNDIMRRHLICAVRPSNLLIAKRCTLV